MRSIDELSSSVASSAFAAFDRNQECWRESRPSAWTCRLLKWWKESIRPRSDRGRRQIQVTVKWAFPLRQLEQLVLERCSDAEEEQQPTWRPPFNDNGC